MSYQVPQHINKDKIFIVKKSEIEGRLDPNPYHNERLEAIKRITETGHYAPLSSVALFSNAETQEIKSGEIYVGLENITSDVGEYVKTENKDSVSSAVIFDKGDILFPKLRPYLNKVFYAAFNGICSTEFYVLKSKMVNAEYLSIFLRSSLVVNQTKHMMTGNTLPRLQTEDVKRLLISVPSDNTQQKIVSLYNSAYKSKLHKEKQAQKLINSIDVYILHELGITLPKPQSGLEDRMFIVYRREISNRLDPYYSQGYFKEAFHNIQNGIYPVVKLKSISTLITSGITPKAGGDAYANGDEVGIPFIRSGNLCVDGSLNLDELIYLKPEIHNKVMKSSQVKKYDLMIAIVGATIGQIGIFVDDFEANINQAIALVRLKDGVNPQYVKEVVKSSIGQMSLNRLKRPVARANINLEEIATIAIPLPPIEKQQEIADYIISIRQQAKALQEEGKSILERTKKEVEQMIMGDTEID